MFYKCTQTTAYLPELECECLVKVMTSRAGQLHVITLTLSYNLLMKAKFCCVHIYMEWVG